MPVISPRVRLLNPQARASSFAPPSATEDRLSDLDQFGDNPGKLRARCYVPPGIAASAPLVVVLHGCTQNAAVYDHGSGWSRLADRHGFILLFPEQQRANNPMLCFNWFAAEHTRRNDGEAGSIRAMIAAMQQKHGVDPQRIFVTGLSAGGAMASAMLANYPELFAGGAIVAGVAYGSATSVAQAFDCMGGRKSGTASQLGQHVRGASSHEGPWPRVQIWQGGADHTVVPSNGEAIVQQWVNVHGLDPQPHRRDELAGHARQAWLGTDGTPLIEHVLVSGMAHGVPLATGGDDPTGVAGAHMLDVGIDSTGRIAAFFGIAPEARETTVQRPATARSPLPVPARGHAPSGPQQVIERALRSAGLMK